MPDITMCPGDSCSIKGECHRHTATETPHRQSFFVTAPILVKLEGRTSRAQRQGACRYYWPNERADEVE